MMVIPVVSANTRKVVYAIILPDGKYYGQKTIKGEGYAGRVYPSWTSFDAATEKLKQLEQEGVSYGKAKENGH